jgi:LuxR family transcriptional regulator, maltose regulon positive regulatory protein
MSNRRLWKVVEHNKYVYVWAWTTHMQGLIHLHRCEWEAAGEHLGRSVEQRFIHFHRAALDSITGFMLAYQALGQEDDIRATMQVLRDYVTPFDDPTLWILVGSAEARLAIMQGGQPEIVSRWLETSALPPEGAMLWWLDLPSVTHCRALIAEGASASLSKAEKLNVQFTRGGL